VLTGVAFTQRGVVLGELIVEENQKEGLSLESTNRTNKANASRFHFSVGSFSIVVSRAN